MDTTTAVNEVLELARARRTLPPPEQRRAIRRAARLTLADIARVTGAATPSTVRAWETRPEIARTPGGDLYRAIIIRLAEELS